jgi:predicted kinase
VGQSEQIPGLWLLVFKGPAGTGKSTLARALGRRLGWPVVDKDDVKDVLDGHTREAGGLAYDVMWRVARRQLLQDLSVVCDSPLTFARGYERAERLAQEAGARLAIIECACADEGTWRARIEGRKALALPAHHQTDWIEFCLSSASLPLPYPIVAPQLVLDTMRDLFTLVGECVNWLGQLAAEADLPDAPAGTP